MAIREKAGVIAKKIEGNPIDPEKIAKDQKRRSYAGNQKKRLFQLKKIS